MTVSGKSVYSVFTLCILCCGAALPADEAADKKRLSGRYVGQVVDGGGERGPVEVSSLLITMDSISGTQPGGRSMGEGSYRIDTSQGRYWLDATGIMGPARGKSFQGIFKMEGETLTWCVANPGKPRPTEFASRPSQGQYVMVLRRQSR